MNRLLVIVPIILLFLLLPLIIGIYVYQDARKRGMSAPLWTLVAILVPSLIGFVVYLVARENYTSLKCARCGSAVKTDYSICPNCGARLRAACPHCSAAVENDWIVCPKCARPLTGLQETVVSPVRPKDKALWKILLLVILIPVALLILLIVSFSLFSVAPYGGSSSFMELTVESYFDQMENGVVEGWYQSVENEYQESSVLRYTQELVDGDETAYYYLIYVPGANLDSATSFGNTRKLSHDTFKLELESHSTGEESVFYCIAVTSEKNHYLEMTFNGEILPFKMIDVDFNPTPLPGIESAADLNSSGQVEVYVEESIIAEPGQ